MDISKIEEDVFYLQLIYTLLEVLSQIKNQLVQEQKQEGLLIPIKIID